jgi:membrane fusion protein, multidrug efflux system
MVAFVPIRTVLLVLAAGALACARRPSTGPQRVAVTVARAERRPMPYQINGNGTVEPMRTVEVLPRVEGTVQAVRFDEGDEVTAGQVLFRIDPRPYEAALLQAGANLSRDQAQSENAARDAARYRELAVNNTVTQEDYQQKQATADALLATVRADSAALAVARLNLDYATIRAPIGGRTGSLTVREGALVRPTNLTPLVTINQLRPILVRFAVPASNLPSLRRYADKPLRVVARPGTGGTGPLDGVLAFMDNHVDSVTGTVLLKGRFANPGGQLWPGEFVDVTLVLDVQPDALVIPAQAVLTSQQGTYVFIVSPDGSANQQAVTVARTVDSLAVIAEGVTPGALVVTDGQLRLTPNARVDIRGGLRTESAGGSSP